MLEKEKIIMYAESLPGAASDKPFENDFYTTVLRHSDSKKWFGILLEAPCRRVGVNRDGYTPIINLKCTPEDGFILKELYSGVVTAYHMNKIHWISVVLDSDVTEAAAEAMILKSYELTLKGGRKINDTR